MLKCLPDRLTGDPCDRCPPTTSDMPITVSPGLSSASYTALLAGAPDSGWTLTKMRAGPMVGVANNSAQRRRASASTMSAYSTPL
ncbi:MAG TPA: hypothetical protein VJ754_09855 [Anaerolineae bacterium]|nr:hypothetical protein [Anaerolineae bacterium]